jgi:hypothetical protein
LLKRKQMKTVDVCESEADADQSENEVADAQMQTSVDQSEQEATDADMHTVDQSQKELAPDPNPQAEDASISADEEARLLAQAIEMSLAPEPVSTLKKPRRTPPAASSRPPAASSSGVNPLWAPPRYVPADDSRGPRTLNLVEEVQVRDAGYSWQRATAFLDTGNQHMTLVDTAFAQRHALYRPDHASQLLGLGTSFGQAERWTTIHGVVPGASTRAPVVTIALKVRNEEIVLLAAVSPMSTHDLLIGKDVLGRLFDAGFRIGAGSM